MWTGAGSQTPFLLNHSYVSLRYYEMGFLPMLKETADVSVPLWYEKFNLKRMREKEWCTAYFHSPHTERYENDVLLCGGNDANRAAEKFLHNSIQFLLNPNGKLLCQREAERQRQKGGGLETKMEGEGTKDWDWNNGAREREGESHWEQPDSLKGKRRQQHKVEGKWMEEPFFKWWLILISVAF